MDSGKSPHYSGNQDKTIARLSGGWAQDRGGIKAKRVATAIDYGVFVTSAIVLSNVAECGLLASRLMSISSVFVGFP